MAKKRTTVTAQSDLIGIIRRIAHEIAAGLDVNDENSVEQLATQLAPDLVVPRIIPDRRYALAELEQFGLKRGIIYKHYRHLLRQDEKAHITFMLGADLLRLNETAKRLPPARRGRPRKDAKRSTDESTDDGITKNRVVIIKNWVVYVRHWDRCARRAA